MKIKYHVALNWTNQKVKIMDSLGIKVKEGYRAIQLNENEYIRLQSQLEKWEATGIRYPEFTKKELGESTLSAKSGGHEHGYPMPDLDFAYLELTYDLSNYCKTCGIGKKQKSNFRLKNVPAKGKKRVFRLGWIPDELFVERDLYEDVFESKGIGFQNILKYNKDTPFDNWVQLTLPQTMEELQITDNPKEFCKSCGRWKYQPMPQGFYPRYKDTADHIFKSQESFGSGATAWNRIFLTKELREKLIELKVEKSGWYIPTKSPCDSGG